MECVRARAVSPRCVTSRNTIGSFANSTRWPSRSLPDSCSTRDAIESSAKSTVRRTAFTVPRRCRGVQAERQLSSTRRKTAPEAAVALPSRSRRTVQPRRRGRRLRSRAKVMNLAEHQQSLSFKMVKREVWSHSFREKRRLTLSAVVTG